MASIGPREMAAVLRVLARGELARYGASGTSTTSRFEEELRRTVGTTHALAVNSGTSALICALAAAGIGPGDEVLVPAYTWVSTAAAPLAVGAVPVLVEVDDTLTMDPSDLQRKIGPHTRAVLPVHMVNLVCDMDSIMKIALDHDLVVIEDACQAFGLRYRGARVGSIGQAGAFSFNQHKNIKSGEGGAVVTDSDKLFARAAMYHDVGSYTRPERFQSDEPLFVGQNLRMPELCSAVLRPQLARIDKQLDRRRKRRAMILDALSTARTFTVAPHNDEDNAIGLAVTFDDAETAKRFSQHRGVTRLYDTGRHLYTNWESVLAGRSFHPAIDPYAWARRSVSPLQDACPRTLEFLERTCTISTAPDLPLPAMRLLVKKMRPDA